MRTFGYEGAVEIHKTKEFTQFGKQGKTRKITNGLYFGIKRSDALRKDFMTEELDSGNPMSYTIIGGAAPICFSVEQMAPKTWRI